MYHAVELLTFALVIEQKPLNFRARALQLIRISKMWAREKHTVPSSQLGAIIPPTDSLEKFDHVLPPINPSDPGKRRLNRPG